MAEAGIIRRKLASGRAAVVEGGPGADRAWRIGLARAARDLLKVSLDVRRLVIERRSLAELAELVPDHALIAVLEGPAEGLGAIIISQPILSGFIEAQTIGRIRNQVAAARKPTRTDAAMMIGVIDAALAGLEQVLAEEADLVWAGGFRYASFLDDPRPLPLLLEDTPLRLLRAEVSLAGGLREGEILLALPAEGRGESPAAGVRPVTEDQGAAFSEALTERVHGATAKVDAVLARLSLPLAQVMTLGEGMVLALPQAALDRISLEGVDGRHVGIGKLGQNRGMRAVRLNEAGNPTDQARQQRDDATGGLSQSRAQPSGHMAGSNFPAMRFSATDAEDLSSFLATGSD